MTTYTLPASATIGTTLYFGGDLVWWNGVEWAPIVTGSTQLNETTAEVLAEEATLVTDESRISVLEERVTFLEEEIDALKNLLQTP